MVKFELKKSVAEVKKREEIKEGVSVGRDSTPELIASFETIEEAEKELKKYTSKIKELSNSAGRYYHLEEFYIEENSYDDDGEFVDGGDICRFSKMNIELVEKPSYEVLATFDNMEEAIKAYNKYDGENEVYISF